MRLVRWTGKAVLYQAEGLKFYHAGSVDLLKNSEQENNKVRFVCYKEILAAK